ncbi:MAG: hypothetical protein EYC62_06420 [Alphaproteobacteria bacterium]|nr:MAG: hypothetical protein EYC62_06420 [Alphaproteobacteria bacterium]
MKKIYAAMAMIAVTMILSGCAGREARPVATYKHGDETLNCAQLRREAEKSENAAIKLYKDHNDAHDGNVVMGTVGAVLFWPALFALDTSDAEKVEMEGHKERIESLQHWMDKKNCPAYKSKIDQMEKEIDTKRRAAPVETKID